MPLDLQIGFLLGLTTGSFGLLLLQQIAKGWIDDPSDKAPIPEPPKKYTPGRHPYWDHTMPLPGERPTNTVEAKRLAHQQADARREEALDVMYPLDFRHQDEVTREAINRLAQSEFIRLCEKNSPDGFAVDPPPPAPSPATPDILLERGMMAPEVVEKWEEWTTRKNSRLRALGEIVAKDPAKPAIIERMYPPPSFKDPFFCEPSHPLNPQGTEQL